MKHYPKYDQRINSEFQSRRLQETKPRFGTVISYDKLTNTATILMDDKHSNTIGNAHRGVSCPSIQGIQAVAPNAGSRCVLGFRDDSETTPYIISFIEEGSSIGKYAPAYMVDTGIPRYMV